MDESLMTLDETPQAAATADPAITCAAREDACVLIIGRPSAALAIASSIHARSARAAGPLTVLGCHERDSSLVDHLTQALSADSREAAGTVLLQEVGQMTPAEQERLANQLVHLRLRPDATGPRLIASNSSPLWDRVEAGQFDERLFYRLNTISVVSEGLG